MNTHSEHILEMAGAVQSPIPANTARRKRVPAKTKPATFGLELKIVAAMQSVDEVLDGLAEEHRDLFLHEMIKTLQAML